MSGQLPRIIALAPGGPGGIAVAVAASRAGALGLLDLAGLGPDEALDACRRAARLVTRGLAIRVDAAFLDDRRLDGLPGSIVAVCPTGEPGPGWARLSGRSVLAEVGSRVEACEAARAGATGLILAGHEAGGLGAGESSLILLQAVLDEGGPQAWVRGGVGPIGAAGCLAAGASGVVLDGALLLAKESPLGEEARAIVGRFDGGESVVIRPAIGRAVRVFGMPGSSGLKALREAAGSATAEGWTEALRDHVGWSAQQAWPVGQDAAFAAELAREHVTVGGIVRAVEAAIDLGLDAARASRPLAPGSAMAVAHGTEYPIVQGPMTRVSDIAAFAEAVADGGGLPFLALAMLRGAEVRPLLEDASARLAGRPWGVGLLGFVEPALRREQVAAVLESRPPFALIAGGRPDQAVELERARISTYLHAPSPGLLAQYLRDGARRFVLEGRECGGHVGPRSSLVLWEQAIAALLDWSDRDKANDAGSLHLLFAGGVHDDRSAAAVAAMAGPLAGRGAKVGVLVGTAYLFTAEAVATGAIVPRFQAEAIGCRETVLLETGPGHEVRVGPSPFAGAFEAERRRLLAEGRPPEEVREALERINAGRLRAAAKGVDRAEGVGSPLVSLDEADQFARGIYMLGQVATLRDRVTTVDALHRAIAEGSVARIEAMGRPADRPSTASRPSDVAIVGMAAILPGAGDVRAFWENTLKGTDAIVEIPPDRWDYRPYYDPDPKAPDKIYSKWGGFVPDVPFDPIRYGMPPASLPSIEPVQLLLLECVRSAIADAGYAERTFPRERTAVVLGMGGGSAQLAMGYAFRSYLPMLESVAPDAGRVARDRAEPLLPEWTEDSFPGFLLNVAAGRVANRFDLGGANYTVDAACGSSLAAASLAVRELEAGAADVVILGGADTVQNPLTYMAFSKTQAFSPRGRCRPFDASADGIVISEGVGVVVLKRLADAERDGDRIYAVIKGLGSSSDGRARGLTAPNVEGQSRALDRAYARAGVDPATVGYVEAHGTGTAVGDVVEINALAGVLRKAGAARDGCAVGSVKSMIGHTKCAAGLAGLINASLALHHRTLPPTIGVERLNPKADLADGPLRVSTRARPWFHADPSRPRRAGVSAFGFGGTNFHAVLEGYDRDPAAPPSPLGEWPAELLLWRDDGPTKLADRLGRLSAALDRGATPRLRDLARSLADRFDPDGTGRPTLAIVATTLDDLRAKLATAVEAIRSGRAGLADPRGVHYAARPAFAGAGLAFLFPGQGSQSTEMLGDLALAFPEVREAFEATDAALIAAGRPPITPKVFPTTTLDEAGRDRARHELMATEVAQPAVGAASVGMLRLLAGLGLSPTLVAGHSYGELVALHAAGSLTVGGLALLSEARGRLMVEAAGASPGAMAAIGAGADRVGPWVEGVEGVVVANLNGPRQTVISGRPDGVARVVERARAEGVRAFELPVSAAFHSEAVAPARGPLAEVAAGLLVGPPDRPVFANLDASPHPADPRRIADRLGEHLASPVRFGAMVDRMHEAGARVFVEVGPGAVLSTLVGSILGDKPHLAVATDAPGRAGIPALLHALARLVAAGVPVRPGRLTADRSARKVDPEDLPVGDGSPAPSATTWLVNGSRARPVDAPEPVRLGQALDRPGPEDEAAQAGTHPPALNGNGHVAPPPRIATMSYQSANGDGHANGNGRHAPEPEGSRRVRAADVLDGPVPTPTSAARTRPEAPAAPADAGAARVIEAFQQTMRAFLEVQQATMLAYLSRRPGAVIPPSAHPPETNPGGTGGSPIGAIGASSPAPRERRPEPSDRVEAAPSLAMAGKPPVPPDKLKETAPATGREAIAARLVEIVRDRTGYPVEMLKLDLDLEADLGIDSIKRVEILGTLRDAIEGLDLAADSTLMDGLTRARTLGEIVGRVEGALRKSKPIAPRVEPPKPGPVEPPPVRRLLIEAVGAPRPEERSGLMPGGLVVVTDDGRGVARALGETLREAGHPVELARPDQVDLSSPTAVEGWLAGAREAGPVAGIVHALPLGGPRGEGLDAGRWSGRVGVEVKGLFHLARASALDLEAASARGGACLVAATALGGGFASSGTAPDEFFPGQGGVAGLVKTLAREWPEVRARVVDLDPSEAAEVLADRLGAEALTDDGWPEVGYLRGRRVRLAAVPAPLGSDGPTLDLKPGEPVLVTGGARGITAAVAAELARRWRPTLLLVGSSPLPGPEEDPATAGVEATAELKAALHGRLRRSGREVGPADLERAYRALLGERQIRASLRGIRAAGSAVDYARADVRDADALGRAVASWRETFGDPVGLVHGAGVIADKLLRDKTPESFDRVLGTKLDGALNVARLLRPEAIRFAALFSSIAGRFGNRGQSDYAAANEALNKLAIWLDRRWPGRVVSVNWGPWSGVGMVSDLEGHLGRRGLGMIPPGAGCAALVRELEFGRKGDVEVVLAGALGSLDAPLRGPARPRPAGVAS